MKLTVHPSDVLPDGFAHFFDAVTISLAAGCTARRHTVNFTIQPVGIVAPLQNFFYRPKESKSFNGTVSQKNISLFGGLNYNTTVDVAEFADSSFSIANCRPSNIFPYSYPQNFWWVVFFEYWSLLCPGKKQSNQWNNSPATCQNITEQAPLSTAEVIWKRDLLIEVPFFILPTTDSYKNNYLHSMMWNNDSG